MNLYTYTSGNLLEKSNTYFYSQYYGRDFLEAWESDRGRVYSALGSELQPVTGRPNLLKSLDDKVKAGESLDTYFIFDAVQGALVEQKIADRTVLKYFIDKLVQKFEVSKRWYLKYNALFRVEDKTKYDDLELYVRGAEIFCEAFAFFGDLPYLNALLKSIDTLCSVYKKLNAKQCGRLASLISKESKYINSLT